MADVNKTQVTEILHAMHSNQGNHDQMAEVLYDQAYNVLHNIASGLMRYERNDHTLQPTALINEAYLKLVDPSDYELENRVHFLGVAARAMRQVLVDHARKHKTNKRGGDWHRITMDENFVDTNLVSYEILALNDALDELKKEDARMARVVELRVFAGLLSREVADVIGVSKRTVDTDWKVAKMWLGRKLSEQDTL